MIRPKRVKKSVSKEIERFSSRSEMIRPRTVRKSLTKEKESAGAANTKEKESAGAANDESAPDEHQSPLQYDEEYEIARQNSIISDQNHQQQFQRQWNLVAAALKGKNLRPITEIVRSDGSCFCDSVLQQLRFQKYGDFLVSL